MKGCALCTLLNLQFQKMELYTKVDEQIDDYYAVASIKKSLSQQNFLKKFFRLIVFLILEFICDY